MGFNYDRLKCKVNPQPMSELTLYHNPRCSKSRQTLALLEERGLKPRIIRYLETPPNAETLNGLLKALGLEPRQLMRPGETPYQALDLANPALSRGELINAMSAHPILIERPIVVANGKAAIGRPPENVLDIL